MLRATRARAVLDWLGASGLQVQRSNRSAKLPHPSLFQNYTWSTSYIWSDVQQLKGKWTIKQTNEQNEQIKAKWTLFNNWGLSIQLCQFTVSLKRLSLKISHTFLSNYLEFSQMKLVFLFVLYFFLRKSHTNRVGCCAVMHVAILSLSIEWL